MTDLQKLSCFFGLRVNLDQAAARSTELGLAAEDLMSMRQDEECP